MLLNLMFLIFYLTLEGVLSQDGSAIVGSSVSKELASALQQGTNVTFAYLEKNPSDLDSALQIMAGVIAPAVGTVVAAYHDNPLADPTDVAEKIGNGVSKAFDAIPSTSDFSGLDVDSIQGEIFATISNELFGLTENRILEVAQEAVLNSIISAIGNGVAEISGGDFTFQVSVETLDQLPADAQKILASVTTLTRTTLSPPIPEESIKQTAMIEQPAVEDSQEIRSSTQSETKSSSILTPTTVVDVSVLADLESGDVLSVIQYIEQKLQTQEENSVVQFFVMTTNDSALNSSLVNVMQDLFEDTQISATQLANIVASVYSENSNFRTVLGEAILLVQKSQQMTGLVELLSNVLIQPSLARDAFLAALDYVINKSGCFGVLDVLSNTRNVVVDGGQSELLVADSNNEYPDVIACFEQAESNQIILDIMDAIASSDTNQAYTKLVDVKTSDQVSVAEIALVTALEQGESQQLVQLFTQILQGNEISIPVKVSIVNRFVVLGGEDAIPVITDSILQGETGGVEIQNTIIYALTETSADITNNFVQLLKSSIIDEECGLSAILANILSDIGEEQSTNIVELLVQGGAQICLPTRFQPIAKSVEAPSTEQTTDNIRVPAVEVGNEEVVLPPPLVVQPLPPTATTTLPSIQSSNEVEEFAPIADPLNVLPLLQSMSPSPMPLMNGDKISPLPVAEEVVSSPLFSLLIESPFLVGTDEEDVFGMPPRGVSITPVPSPSTDTVSPTVVLQGTAQEDPTAPFSVTFEDAEMYVPPAVPIPSPSSRTSTFDPTAPSASFSAETEETEKASPIPEELVVSPSLQDITQILAQAVAPAPEEPTTPSILDITEILSEASVDTQQPASEKSKTLPSESTTLVEPMLEEESVVQVPVPSHEVSIISTGQELNDNQITDILQQNLMLPSPVVQSSTPEKSPLRRNHQNNQSPKPKVSPSPPISEIIMDDTSNMSVDVNVTQDFADIVPSPVPIRNAVAESTTASILNQIVSATAEATTTSTNTLTETQEECVDIPPDNDYSCEEQYNFGKCAREWMQQGNFCAKTCGFCPLNCTNIQPMDKLTCEEHRELGLCNEESVVQGDYCRSSCGRCSGDSTNLSKSEVEEAASTIITLDDAGILDDILDEGNNCTDILPVGSQYTCEEQKSFGKCEAMWMIADDYCEATCGRCF